MTRKQLFEWVKEEYDTDPDYPWQDWNAVLRHKDSRKWYGLVMEIDRSKLGLPGDGVVDALNVKCDPRIIGSLLGQPGYFRVRRLEDIAVARRRLAGNGNPVLVFEALFCSLIAS